MAHAPGEHSGVVPVAVVQVPPDSAFVVPLERVTPGELHFRLVLVVVARWVVHPAAELGEQADGHSLQEDRMPQSDVVHLRDDVALSLASSLQGHSLCQISGTFWLYIFCGLIGSLSPFFFFFFLFPLKIRLNSLFVHAVSRESRESQAGCVASRQRGPRYGGPSHR